MTFAEVWLESIRLCEAGLFAAATVLAREAVVMRPHAWQTHQHLAATLQNSAVETRNQLGAVQPRTRSSFERIALIREALEQLDVARSVAKDDRARAYIDDERRRVFAMWGAPLFPEHWTRRPHGTDANAHH